MIGLIIAGVVAAVAAVGEGVASYEASQAALQEQEEMIKTQQLKNKYDTLVNKNKTLDQMDIALQKNEAHMAVSGARFNSPSFMAANTDIVEKGDEARRNADSSEAINDYVLQMQRDSAQQQAAFRTYGIVAKTAGSLAESYMSASSGFTGAAASSGSGLTNRTATGAPWANWEGHYV